MIKEPLRIAVSILPIIVNAAILAIVAIAINIKEPLRIVVSILPVVANVILAVVANAILAVPVMLATIDLVDTVTSNPAIATIISIRGFAYVCLGLDFSTTTSIIITTTSQACRTRRRSLLLR